MISLRDVNRSFGDHRVLKDISFDIRPGRMTGFVGGNGAGKTTTMRIILGVLTPDSGSVEVDGAPITGWRRGSSRSAPKFHPTPEAHGPDPA